MKSPLPRVSCVKTEIDYENALAAMRQTRNDMQKILIEQDEKIQKLEAEHVRLVGINNARADANLELRETLAQLWRETVASGNDHAPDYGWPAVRARVLKALGVEE